MESTPESQTTVHQALASLDSRGLVRRWRRDASQFFIENFESWYGRAVPEDLLALYRANISEIDDYAAFVFPNTVKDRRFWSGQMPKFMKLGVVPIFGDGCGNYFCFDLDPGDRPAGVYFTELSDDYSRLDHIAGTTLARFLLILGVMDEAYRDGWPSGWELQIDSDLDAHPKAPPIWVDGPSR